MLGGISIWQLLIVLGIIILIFGTKKLRNVGGDLGNAVKGFKKAVSDEDKQDDASDKAHARVSQEENGHTYDVNAEHKSEEQKERK